MYALNIEIIYFDSFGVEHVLKKIERLVGHENIKTNIFRIQANNSIMCGYFCFGFTEFLLAGKTLIYYSSLLSPYDFEKNNNLTVSYFKNE